MVLKTQNFVTNLIISHNKMVMSPAENNIAYTSTFWYTSPDGQRLYFFSRTATRQCQIFTNYPLVSVSIYDPASTCDALKGYHMLGCVEKVSNAKELKEVAAGYIAAFPASEKMIANFLPGMIGPASPVAFYRVRVEQVKALNAGIDILQPENVII